MKHLLISDESAQTSLPESRVIVSYAQSMQLRFMAGLIISVLTFGLAQPVSASSDDQQLAGRVVALDPGHGGGAGANKLVSDGRGHRKPCNTSGTSTNQGYTEHQFTLDVAKRTAKLLRQHGIIVKMTRTTDNLTKALCVNRRGTFGQRVGAELMVSIHGDGNNNPNFKGYFALVSSPPLNKAQGAASRDLGRRLMRQLDKQGFTRNKAFSGGWMPRSDTAGLNFSKVPTVMMELGEMRNPTEARLMSSKSGRQRYAQALADGIINYLK
ncbi:MAG: N-acetylmuramoyl-L-alanine amidase, partial [Bifidobacteriaceae bacterium]|nr:N-acetylmuramoyl-L-alanine amidase [Bifidobacteriaceae bacterium]